MKAAPAPSGILAVDTSTKLTAALVRALSAATWNGEPIRGICRYVSINAAHLDVDISPAELATIIDPQNDVAGTGLGCWLVQHVRYGVGSVERPEGWTPSAQLGSYDGRVARKHAYIVGYSEGCHLGLDLEGVNPRATPEQVRDYCIEWARAVSQDDDIAKYEPLLYDGYSPGLTPEQLWQLPPFHLYWTTRGGGGIIPQRGSAIAQVALDVELGGVRVDVNRIRTDALGGNLVWCVADDRAAT